MIFMRRSCPSVTTLTFFLQEIQIFAMLSEPTVAVLAPAPAPRDLAGTRESREPVFMFNFD